MAKKKPIYIVANPRAIPLGRHVLRIGERVWFEGDAYDGPATDRLVRDGFVVKQGKVSDG